MLNPLKLLEVSLTWNIARKQAKIDFPELNFWCPKELAKHSEKRIQLEKKKGITAMIIMNHSELDDEDAESYYIYFVNHQTQTAIFHKQTSEYSEASTVLKRIYT